MSTQELDPCVRLVVRKQLIDRVTVKVAAAFAKASIDSLVLKGPVLADWLYPGEVRPYCDSDMMVAPRDRPEAIRVLQQLGFRSWVLAPLSVDPGGTAFQRGEDVVDLHCAIPGLFGDPAEIWASLLARSERKLICGADLRVPDPDMLLLHVGLHAGHHANDVECKAFEDLRRAIDCTDEQQWHRALELARAYDGVNALATGLQLLPEGRDLARRLGLEGVHTFRFDLRREGNPIAEEIGALFSSDASVTHKLVTVVREVFPRPEYMRWWSPLARRGALGLAAAYVWRPLWAVRQVPRALFVLRRVGKTVSG